MGARQRLDSRARPAVGRAAAVAALLFGLACARSPSPLPPGAAPDDSPPPVEREFRGVWIASVANLDWPSRPGLPPDTQRAELARMLDRAVDLRLNAVILQVRPAADALYASALEPWSEWLTGAQGTPPDPYYDPLAWAIEQAHARGLELHAWFNPYRAWSPAARGAASADHISRARPELVRSYGDYLWLDPGEPDVLRHSIDVIVDVVRRYDVDGVHIDDYFYPYRESDAHGREIDFPDSASYARYRAGGGRLERSDWRRDNVNRFVAAMYRAVRAEKTWVKVGVSPIGTWRPNVVPQLGGFDAYESIYADARRWILDGTLDYLVPQLYWPIARTDMSFPVLLDWWARQNPHRRGLYAGLIPDRVNHGAPPREGWPPEEIIGQVYVTRGHPGAGGHVHFRMRSLMPDGALAPVADTLPLAQRDSISTAQRRLQARRDSMNLRLREETYARPALVPRMPWLDDTPPPAPRATRRDDVAAGTIEIAPGAGEPAFLWVVQFRSPEGWRTEIVPAHVRRWRADPAQGAAEVPRDIRVSAVDRSGNQSAAVRVGAPGSW